MSAPDAVLLAFVVVGGLINLVYMYLRGRGDL